MQGDPSITIREMKPGEEKALLGAARRAFIHSPLEQLGISKPKSALVAEVDGAVAGAMFLRVFGTGEKKQAIWMSASWQRNTAGWESGARSIPPL